MGATISQKPLTAYQVELSGAEPFTDDVGFFFIKRTTTGTLFAISPTSGGQEVSKIYQTNLISAESFTVQMFPNLNPFLLLVFSEDPTPQINRGIKYLFTAGSVTTPFAATARMDTSVPLDIRGGSFGPIPLPANFRYFRAYQYTISGATGANGWQPDFTTTNALNTYWNRSHSIVTFFGR